jgi:hypothetical protein
MCLVMAVAEERNHNVRTSHPASLSSYITLAHTLSARLRTARCRHGLIMIVIGAILHISPAGWADRIRFAVTT